MLDQATGMIAVLGRVSPDQGRAVLNEISQYTRIKLRHVAELILTWGRTGELPTEVHAELDEALGRQPPADPRHSPAVTHREVIQGSADSSPPRQPSGRF
ncbi:MULTISPECIES: ANTAR domain-containing protein [unclassified Streptomyces]|uniref:ANTAR domain-containing protein n=1 Tax=unclassified Streptomyces TaxID=2593676 RepID=UPI0036E58BFB